MGTYEQLDEWRNEALSDLVDSRIADPAWLDAWLWFWLHQYADLNEYDAVFRGCTFKEKDGYWLLVVKLEAAGTRQVVFVSSANPTRCVQKYKKLLRANEVQMSLDKFT